MEKRVSLALVSSRFFLITMDCIVTAGFAMIILWESLSDRVLERCSPNYA